MFHCVPGVPLVKMERLFKYLIISVFHSVPGVPCAKMERMKRFGGVDTQTCASPQRCWRRVFGLDDRLLMSNLH